MSQIKLSICIPTYNFGKYISETLESIIKQADDDVEIVVLDGASTDNTSEVVKKYQSAYPRLLYHCLENKGGIDKDLVKAVEASHGEYCWLMSSDDTITENAINEIKNKLSFNYAVLLFCRTICSYELKPKYDNYFLKKNIENSVYKFAIDSELLKYFDAAQDLAALFSYISSIIIKRSEWDSVPINERLVGTAYAHVHRIMSILRKGGTLYYSSQRIVFARIDNDSFLTDKKIDRFMLDINGYKKIADNLFFKDDILKASFLNILKRHHSWKSLYKARIDSGNRNDWKIIKIRLIDVKFCKAKLLIVGYTYYLFILAKIICRRK